jgi:starch synthase
LNGQSTLPSADFDPDQAEVPTRNVISIKENAPGKPSDMRVLFVTSEAFPFAKTGGLADVSAALPAALSNLGIDVRVLMPAYPQALGAAAHVKEIARLGTVLGFGTTRLLETHFPQTHVPVWLVDCPELYNRVGGPYQDEDGVDWPDSASRFALLNHVAAGIAIGGRWQPDIVHANDWHAALVPLLLSQQAWPRPATLFTIHNLCYQGLFDADVFQSLALPSDSFRLMEFWGRISLMKAAIGTADAITTVSPTYANEILSPEYGCGLDGLLRERAASITGILNGADYGQWDPGTDPHIPRNYTPTSLALKGVCKRAIQAEFGLFPDADTPLLAFMSRLVHQKMPDVLLEVLPPLLESGMQFALVAEGESQYQDGFRRLAARYPGRVGVNIGYHEPLAHRLVSGADMLLHPSRFEPCGLVPIYAMRYGTVPIVRNSGGMADTVTDATPETLKSGSATGFSFDNICSIELARCVHRAVALYRQSIHWRKLQHSAMQRDFSWRNSAKRYAAIYRTLGSDVEAGAAKATVVWRRCASDNSHSAATHGREVQTTRSPRLGSPVQQSVAQPLGMASLSVPSPLHQSGRLPYA